MEANKKLEFHTVVFHKNPDLEPIFMYFLIVYFEEVRQILGIIKDHGLKFIPAGKLRPEDWTEEDGLTELTAEALRERGYLFIDCGGGELDQHGKEFDGKRKSSLQLLAETTNLFSFAPHLQKVASAISANDVHGQNVVRDDGYQETALRHTQRHLRNVVEGLRLTTPRTVLQDGQYRFDPGYERLIHLILPACYGIEALAREMYRQKLEKGYQKLLLVDVIHGAIKAAFATPKAPDAGQLIADAWLTSAVAALGAYETAWDEAIKDLPKVRKGRIRHVHYRRTRDGQTSDRPIRIVIGESDSPRFGAVARSLESADVIVQFPKGFMAETKFLISTKGIPVDLVAKAIRQADFEIRGVKLTDDDIARLAQPGHLAFPDQDGQPAEALLLTEYQTSFGNNFRANPDAETTPLCRHEIVSILCAVLRGDR